MSTETLTDLNSNTLIGYTDRRGHAWHYRADAQSAESNHYPGAIPVEDVRRRLFNWTAVQGEVTATAITPDGVLTTTDPTRKAIMRSDNGSILGIFKSGYQVHQYDDWLVRNVENILDADLSIGSAGLLNGGRRAWVQVEMADTLEVEGVEFRPFLTAATSMDGSLATTYLRGAQVVVCDNTLSVALGNATESYKVKHSRNSLVKINDVRDALAIVHTTAETFAAQVRTLVNDKVTDDEWNRFVTAYTATESDSKRSESMALRKASDLNALYNFDERVTPWKGTAYGVLAAVNTYVHHGQTVRGASRADRNAERVITGGVDKMDRDALGLLAAAR